ncbi:MAG: hypothetical protein K2K81_07410 [Muribaculaceae bacterium]|nr:hypothetical protein [Muribaculaceae bacterium]
MAEVVTKQALQGAVNELVEKLKPIVITPFEFMSMWNDDSSSFSWNESVDEYFQDNDLGSYMAFSYVPPGFAINGNNDSLSALYDRIKDACLTRQGFTLAIMGEIGCVLLQHDFTDVSSQTKDTRFKPILNPDTGEFFMPMLVIDESSKHKYMYFALALMNLLPAVPPRDNCLYGIKNGKYVKITDPDQVLVVTARPEEAQAASLSMDGALDAPKAMSLEEPAVPGIPVEDTDEFTGQSEINSEDYE